MMICFTCTAETKDLLDELVTTGSYRDYGEVIAAAVRNQMLFEKEVASKGSIVIGDTTPAPERPATVSATRAAPKPAPKPRARDEPPKPVPGIPVLFGRDGFPDQPPAGLLEPPQDTWLPGQAVPLDRWVFGQQNRLFPAKVNARALIRLFSEAGKGLPISKTAAQIAAEAANLGDYLQALDTRLKTPRDDALATAFPNTGENADKGRARYASQFVVYQNSRNELSGLMFDFKLISVVSDRKESVIVPTKAAWDLATLVNPVLDAVDGEPPAKFSAEERALLLDHITAAVPVEAFAYRAILETIRDGSNTPEKIDAALKAHVSANRAEELSQSFLASQRSGAVSRMSDLGLVERHREGIRVFYAVTEEGGAFLAHT